MSEDVMVVNPELIRLFITGSTSDLIRLDPAALLEAIEREHSFVNRDTAETSPAYKQIIPYVVLRFDRSFFTLRRTTRQREFRLHNKVSLGIGGHINPEDRQRPGGLILGGLAKELHEEVDLSPDEDDLEFLGILNDESTEVSRVHLGLVYVLHVRTPNVAVRETEKMIGEWLSVDDLAPQRESMESWSEIIYDHYIRDAATTARTQESWLLPSAP